MPQKKTRKRKSSAMSGDTASKPSKIINDPVHGHIELPNLCVRIIDTPQFQRLRYVRQMGGVYFVYPGAAHNRFEHSLGVCHLAGEMIENLRSRQPNLGITDEDKLCVQVAGLCHDLGHGPFSHVFDGQIMAKARPDIEWKHEKTSGDMFDHLLRENKIDLTEHELEEGDRTFIKKMILGKPEGEGRGKEKGFLYQIIANKETGIDVDKLDYFARDSHGLGISASFDHKRLMKVSRVIRDQRKEWKICFRDKDVNSLYDMFQTRYILRRRACRHKTVVAIEAMIADAILFADKHILTKGKCITECVDDMAAYTQLTDNVYDRILHSDAPELTKARSILERIQKRDLYRYVGQAKPRKDHIWKTPDSALKKEVMTMDKSLTEKDLFVTTLMFDYGKGNEDPIKYVKFYSKDKPDETRMIPRDKVSYLLPERFMDQVICCYSCTIDVADKVKDCFVKWCTHNEARVDIV